MKPLFLALLTLALGVVLGLVFLNEPGYVLIGYGQWSVETSLSLLLFALLLGFIVLYALLRLLAGGAADPPAAAGLARPAPGPAGPPFAQPGAAGPVRGRLAAGRETAGRACG
ncbi:heme biosynthesis HemY N-terminal domain-containing protein [Thiohalobacter thiocyanaticus]|uniref:HemY N-terminal domain-containing protein n=1 Tax=Thiohalobacter thiocyanaticus TaxID=585455 RepID=A0A426QJC4_9GAMM|nr:heme biosynthesis HemY N-terminal domain-containing protein [Thiohalobacter thiocyanaticus]RRQ21864.1 hypothetical protein D6C00_07835 [Thiohalobacter thiocyanaticus]